jgi:hypothetical protein
VKIEWTDVEAANLLRKFYDVANLGCALDERRVAVAGFASDVVSLFLARASGQVKEDVYALRTAVSVLRDCQTWFDLALSGDLTTRPQIEGASAQAGAALERGLALIDRLAALAQKAEALRAKVEGLHAALRSATDIVGEPLLNRCIALRDAEKERAAARAEVERLKAGHNARCGACGGRFTACAGCLKTALAHAGTAESRLAAIREKTTKASAELRHAYRAVGIKQNIDPSLVARAIRILETLEGDAPQEAKSPAVEAVEMAAAAGLPARVAVTYRAVPVCGKCANAPCLCPCGPSWPCSPTCTHDDAATPGHPERVKERSEAVAKALGGIIVTRREATPEEQSAYSVGHDAGAEAMREACLYAVEQECEVLGWTATGSESIRARFKAAIEGAAP